MKEKYIKLAQQKIVPPGYKPEDYAILGPEFAVWIAKMIVEEAKHIEYMEQLNVRHSTI